MKQNKLRALFTPTNLLIALCWLVYMCSYLGKLGYNANITQIEEAYSLSHSTTGVVSTFFFFAYGIGQIFNGIFCKKYNIRFIVFGSLIVSGLMNLLVGLSDNFTFVKYFWLVNGAALSVLWPSLIRLLSETLDKENIGKAVVVMGTTVATGTFLVYGLSALFVGIGHYVLMFFLAGILLPAIALLWILFYPKLVKKPAKTEEDGGQVRVEDKKQQKIGWLWVPIILLAIFAIFDNLTKDGLTTWVPMILKETYELPDYISILLTMLLPILAIFGVSVAVALRKKIKDFITLSGVLFVVSAIFIGLVILCMPTGWFVLTLGCFGVVSCLMAGVNNIITSMAPLYWKDKVNSGLLAGVLNGFCYLGSTLSAYGLGLIAELGGWDVVFWLLFSLCAAAALISAVYTVVKLCRKKN